MTEFDGRLRKADWSVRDVSLEIGRTLVEKYHYAAGGSNSRTYMHGLFQKDAFFDSECKGVAWWIPPTRDAAIATCPWAFEGVLSLSRLVITPDVPKNACTFLLARSARLIDKDRWPVLVTYADSWQGHTGGIYRAAGWEYVGLTTPESTWTLGGVMKSRKAGGKTRTHAEMRALGATNEGRHARHKFVLFRCSTNDERVTP